MTRNKKTKKTINGNSRNKRTKKTIDDIYLRNNEDIFEAVVNWCSDPDDACMKYGDISMWNTSA